MTEHDDKEVMTLNQDVIRSLRKRGMHDEAKQILESYWKIVREQRRQERKEIVQQQQKKEYHRRRVIGLCVISGCPEQKSPGTVRCKHHEKGVKT